MTTTEKKALIARLKAFRLRSEMSLETMGRELGNFSYQTIYRWEGGKNLPDDRNCILIQGYLLQKEV